MESTQKGRPPTAGIRRNRTLAARVTDIEHADFVGKCEEAGVEPSVLLRAFTSAMSVGMVATIAVDDGEIRVDGEIHVDGAPRDQPLLWTVVRK